MLENMIVVALSIVVLFTALWLVRWWREQSYALRSKTILITGGSRGLGLVIARQLADAGAKLAICARDAKELDRAKTELEQRGGEVLSLTCDVTDHNQVEQVVNQVIDRFGTIDVLINNAGMDIVGSIHDMTMQDYDDTMKLHFWAPLYATYAVLPTMRQRGAGRIVNMSSVGGKVAFPHMVPYCASKFALVGLSEGLRSELAKDNISVTTVCPGTIRTGVLDHVIFKGKHRNEYAWFSLMDSLPLVSTSAENVAKQTIAAFRRGAAEVIMPLPIWVASKFYALLPGLNTELLSRGNRLLPEPGGIGTDRAYGKDSRPSWLPSWLLVLSDRAARRNNEIAVAETDNAIDNATDNATDNTADSCP